MSAAAQPRPPGQYSDPNAEDFLGTEHDHLWWLSDAARLVRDAAWDELDPQHLCHLLEEVRDLQALLAEARAVAALEIPF